MKSPRLLLVLFRLQYRNFFRGDNKSKTVGLAVTIAYFWVLEFILFHVTSELHSLMPRLLSTALCLSAVVPDFVLKLIILRDNSVMDAFLKTRPISQNQWSEFLLLTQIWKVSNLIMPIIMAPVCFRLLGFFIGFSMFLFLYSLSVLGGIIVMTLKYRGTYQAEKEVKYSELVNSNIILFNNIFGLQLHSFFRSKRLRQGVIVLAGFCLLEFIFQSIVGSPVAQNLFLLSFISIVSIVICQYGLGIEACFFNGIWSKPLPVFKLLTDKYYFSALLSGLAVIIMLPFCLWLHTSVFATFAFALFTSGIGGLVLLSDAYKCTRFDLFGKTFFNYQGVGGTFKASTVLGTVLIIVIGTVVPMIISEQLAYLIISILGILGFTFHRPFFRWVERRFMENKHKYLEKYMSL